MCKSSFCSMLMSLHVDTPVRACPTGAVTSHDPCYVRAVLAEASVMRKFESPDKADAFTAQFIKRSAVEANTPVGFAAIQLEAWLHDNGAQLNDVFVETYITPKATDFLAIFRGRLDPERYDRMVRETASVCKHKILVSAGDVNQIEGIVSELTVIQCTPVNTSSKVKAKKLKEPAMHNLTPTFSEDYQTVIDEGGLSDLIFTELYGVEASTEGTLVEHTDGNGVVWRGYNGRWFPDVSILKESDDVFDRPVFKRLFPTYTHEVIVAGFGVLSAYKRGYAQMVHRVMKRLIAMNVGVIAKNYGRGKGKYSTSPELDAKFTDGDTMTPLVHYLAKKYIAKYGEIKKRAKPYAESIDGGYDRNTVLQNESLGYRIKSGDKRLIAAYVNGDSAKDGPSLSVDRTGALVSVNGGVVAYRIGNYIGIGDVYGNVSQTWANAVRREAKKAGKKIVGESEDYQADMDEGEGPADAQAVKALVKAVTGSRSAFIAKIIRPIALYKKRGDFDASRAPMLAKNLVNAAGKSIGGGADWHKRFNPATRMAAQKAIVTIAMQQIGKPDVVATLPKKYGGAGGFNSGTGKQRTLKSESIEEGTYGAGVEVEKRQKAGSQDEWIVALNGKIIGLVTKFKRSPGEQHPHKAYKYHGVFREGKKPDYLGATYKGMKAAVNAIVSGRKLDEDILDEARNTSTNDNVPPLSKSERPGKRLRINDTVYPQYNLMTKHGYFQLRPVERKGEFDGYMVNFVNQFNKAAGGKNIGEFDTAIGRFKDRIEAFNQAKSFYHKLKLKLMETDEASNPQVAQIIQRQLGRKALLMMGAKQQTAATDDEGNPSLQFRIGKNKLGANMIQIGLQPNDTYRIRFMSVRGLSVKAKKIATDVYSDRMHAVIQNATGLALSLTHNFEDTNENRNTVLRNDEAESGTEYNMRMMQTDNLKAAQAIAKDRSKFEKNMRKIVAVFGKPGKLKQLSKDDYKDGGTIDHKYKRWISDDGTKAVQWLARYEPEVKRHKMTHQSKVGYVYTLDMTDTAEVRKANKDVLAGLSLKEDSDYAELDEAPKVKYYKPGAIVHIDRTSRRYVITGVTVFNGKSYSYDMVALSGGLNGSGPSNVDGSQLTLSKDQTFAFKGAKKESLARTYQRMIQYSQSHPKGDPDKYRVIPGAQRNIVYGEDVEGCATIESPYSGTTQ